MKYFLLILVLCGWLEEAAVLRPAMVRLPTNHPADPPVSKAAVSPIHTNPTVRDTTSPYIIVLGTAQDAGYPQAGCEKECCKRAWRQPQLKRMVSSLAVVDPAAKQWWLLDATPDMKEQLQLFRQLTKAAYNYLPDGILLTHAHTGHYTGLMELGREAMSTRAVPVYALPKMRQYLENNGPWSQLVLLRNIELRPLGADSATVLNGQVSVRPFTVPHRDEFSETAGFSVMMAGRQLLFIPDIDKWSKFNQPVDSIVQAHDISFLDGTFFRDGELPNRPMSEVPHPFVEETMRALSALTPQQKKSVYFIHLNHTNPLLNRKSAAYRQTAAEFDVAEQGRVYGP